MITEHRNYIRGIVNKNMQELRQKAIFEITENILEVANLYNEVTTSDLQGIAEAKATQLFDTMAIKT